MEESEAITAGNTALTLVIAADYGGRWDIVEAARRLAVELGPEDIRVNNVCPGSMVTNFGIGGLGVELPQAALDGMAKLQPLGRILDPSEPAQVALFLASDFAKNITGVNVPVDGGVSAGK